MVEGEQQRGAPVAQGVEGGAQQWPGAEVEGLAQVIAHPRAQLLLGPCGQVDVLEGEFGLGGDPDGRSVRAVVECRAQRLVPVQYVLEHHPQCRHPHIGVQPEREWKVVGVVAGGDLLDHPQRPLSGGLWVDAGDGVGAGAQHPADRARVQGRALRRVPGRGWHRPAAGCGRRGRLAHDARLRGGVEPGRAEVRGEFTERRVGEEVTQRDGHVERLVHGGDDLHPAQRVEAVVGQRTIGVDGLGELQHPLDQFPQPGGDGVLRRYGYGCRRRGRRCRALLRNGGHHAVALGDQHGLPEHRTVPPCCHDRGEALLGQQHRPGLRRGQRRVREPEFGVVEGPPTLQYTSADGEQGAYRGQFVEHQPAAGCEQRLGLAQGGPQVAGGVHHVGGDHQIDGAWLEALLVQLTFQVEHLVAREGVAVGEALPTVLDEPRRDVGEGEAHPFGVCRQRVQDPLAGGAGSRPQFQDLQTAVGGGTRKPGVEEGAQGVMHPGVTGVRERVALVEALHQPHRGTGEHDLGGPEFATQDARIVLEEEPVQGDRGLDVGMVVRDAGEGGVARFLGLPGIRDSGVALAVPGEQAGVDENVEQRHVKPSEAVHDAQGAP